MRYLLADVRTRQVREMWRDTDEAFITIGFGGLPEAQPIKGGAEFLVVSEQDGWMHVHRVTRDGKATLVTRGTHGRDGDLRGGRGGRLCSTSSPRR